MGRSATRNSQRGLDSIERAGRDGRPALIRAALFNATKGQRNQSSNMNQPEIEITTPDLPLPESQRELEMLLEALNALNAALDQYEIEEPVHA